MTERSSVDVGDYYDQEVDLEHIRGAGLIWFMGNDHLSPPLKKEEPYSSNAALWKDAITERVLSLAQKMGVEQGQKVLDLGTGIGGPGRDIANEKGADVYGVNISGEQIENLLDLSERRGSDFNSVVKGDMQNIPLHGDLFDHVYSINAIYHVPDPEAVIQESGRVLNQDGRIGIDDWFVTDKIPEKKHDTLRKKWSTTDQGFHEYEGFTRLLEDNGIEIIRTEDFTEDAGEFLSEENFGKTYDEQVAPVLKQMFPKIYEYEGYKPEHAEEAVADLREDILYMGELYRNNDAVYRQIIGTPEQL